MTRAKVEPARLHEHFVTLEGSCEGSTFPQHRQSHVFWPPWSLNVPRPSKIEQHRLWTRSNLPWGGEGFLARQQGLCDEGFTMRVSKTRLMLSNSLPLLICEIFLYTILSTSTWCPKMIRYFYSISPSHLPISSPLMVFNTLTNTCALVPVLVSTSHSAWELGTSDQVQNIRWYS